MKEKLTVIKVGGKIVEEPDTLNQLLDDFSSLSGYKVLVHGGGRSATRIASQLGIESQMVNGRRITDAETLKVVTMVYGGLVNKNIVAGLQAKGVNAVGLTGADMNVIRSVKRPVKDIDYGYVGDVEKVDGKALADLIHRQNQNAENHHNNSQNAGLTCIFGVQGNILGGKRCQPQIMGNRITSHCASEYKKNGGENRRLNHREGNPAHNLPPGRIENSRRLLQVGIHIPENSSNQNIGKGRVMESQNNGAGNQSLTPPLRCLKSRQGS